MVKGVSFEIVQNAYALAVNEFRRLTALEHAEGNEAERKATDKQELEKAIERHAIETKPATSRRHADRLMRWPVPSPRPKPYDHRPRRKLEPLNLKMCRARQQRNPAS